MTGEGAMSRSYKKFAVFKDRNSKVHKRMAKKIVRLKKSVLNGGQYKKHYCSWNICDYRILAKFYTAEEFRRMWFDKNEHEFDWIRQRFQSWKVAYRNWLRWCRMK